jgi:Uncharacterized protein conserved in bacteria (DUF2188)
MPKPEDVRVLPDERDWKVEQGGRVLSKHGTQEEAISSGREVARRDHGEFVVHGHDGRIREKDSFGNDPHPPKG